MVVFGQGRLEIGCGEMVWASLVSAPLHEEDGVWQAKVFFMERFISRAQQVQHTVISRIPGLADARAQRPNSRGSPPSSLPEPRTPAVLREL